MRSLIIEPTTLTFITTYTCTSACKNCCFQCHPKRTERLTVDDMKRYIDISVESYKSLKLLVLTGGEAFIYGDKLDEIISHASAAGLMTRIVSNGFWAKDYDKTYKRIQKLVGAGLNEINFSTGDDHLEFVPIGNIMNGTLASLRQGLTVAVNVESAAEKEFESKLFLENLECKEYLVNKKLHIVNGLWISFDKSTKRHTDCNNEVVSHSKQMIHKGTFTRCRNIFAGITIDPNHRLLSCCGLTSKRINYLDLGDIREFAIKELYDRQFNDFLKIWIATDGVHRIMDFISSYSNVDQHYKIEHPCMICEEIFKNTQYMIILKKNYHTVYSNILLKYFINKKEIENEKAQ